MPTPRINEIVRERRGVTADTALRLARFFETTPQFWLGMQAEYELRIAEIKAAKRIEIEVQPRPVA